MSELPHMLKRNIKFFIIVLLTFTFLKAQSQQKVLGLKEAEQIALANYGSIKAKTNQLNASKAYLTETKTEQLPDVNISAQQDYGTVNSQFGPLYGYKGLSVASSGPITNKQNWNTAFGSLYLSNVSWDFFSFGKAVEKVKVQKSTVSLNETDLVQEQFQHEVRVASTYLNLLAAQQLSKAQEDNLNRAIDLQKVVVARVKNGLNPGVDSSQANAEVSNARIALTNARETEAEQSNQLAQYLGIAPQSFNLDSTFVTQAPINADPLAQVSLTDHPTLRYYQNRINVSDEEAKYLNTFSYPTFTLFGVYQGRGSGFNSGYSASNPGDYSSSYGAGADPTRFNYLFGVGLIWNITSPFRVHYQVKSQKYTSAQYQDEYNLASQQLTDQQALAETRISNAMKNFRESPEEVRAATDAYRQKYALYQNGLANIVDFTQALYVLNRAEVDNYIVKNNVWQALLYKAAAMGDFGIFINNF
ncbi:TolC family protein [uncultured Mucilaginibacter sp.]|uniref:TolC family protein n=1 Tax=uncultured Mucilaginibacter sp. TaxID=797541 RepID=UPI0025D4DF28|nr:TolC family protein [uncultured Mucilaginibacter sp.]